MRCSVSVWYRNHQWARGHTYQYIQYQMHMLVIEVPTAEELVYYSYQYQVHHYSYIGLEMRSIHT